MHRQNEEEEAWAGQADLSLLLEPELRPEEGGVRVCLCVGGGWKGWVVGGGDTMTGKDWDWQDRGEKDGEAVKASKTDRDRRLVMQKEQRGEEEEEAG